jgi:hypothetical protein
MCVRSAPNLNMNMNKKIKLPPIDSDKNLLQHPSNVVAVYLFNMIIQTGYSKVQGVKSQCINDYMTGSFN